MLTNYNGTAITYDGIGNPLNWRNATSLTWQGRSLTAMVVNGTAMSFEYNSDGIRQSKTYGNTTVNYITDGSKIIAEYSGNTYTYYIYDENGTIMGMMYNNQLYTFRKNLQGDVTGIYTANGNLVVEYTYSPYGEVLSVTGTLASTIGTSNPFRYRGYYYDTEIGFYYLNSRYYDPVVGRFINSDDVNVLYVEQGSLMQYNAFAYCLNNPINRYDKSGLWSLKDALDVAVEIAVAPLVLVSPTVVTTATFVVTTAMAIDTTATSIAPATTTATKASVIVGATNNAVNYVYYNNYSDEDNAMGQEEGKTAYNDRYIPRSERLDYAKKQTGEESFNLNSWRYYSEYSLHMYGWYATSWAYEKDVFVFSNVAQKCKTADVLKNEEDDRWYVRAASTIIGFFWLLRKGLYEKIVFSCINCSTCVFIMQLWRTHRCFR